MPNNKPLPFLSKRAPLPLLIHDHVLVVVVVHCLILTFLLRHIIVFLIATLHLVALTILFVALVIIVLFSCLGSLIFLLQPCQQLASCQQLPQLVPLRWQTVRESLVDVLSVVAA